MMPTIKSSQLTRESRQRGEGVTRLSTPSQFTVYESLDTPHFLHQLPGSTPIEYTTDSYAFHMMNHEQEAPGGLKTEI